MQKDKLKVRGGGKVLSQRINKQRLAHVTYSMGKMICIFKDAVTIDKH